MLRFVAVLLLAAAVTAVPAVDPRIDENGSWAGRIVGGSNANIANFPLMASMRSSGNAHFCGGAIVNSLNVVTAAHCIIGRTNANTISVFGTTFLNSGGTSRGSAMLLLHANYNQNTLANDIAMVRTSSAIPLGGNIQPASFTTGNVGAVAVILIGWGRLSTNGPLPNNLQQLNANSITVAACQSAWGTLVTATQICVTSPAGQGVCQGDSGGPMIVSSNRAHAGIASFIRAGGCGQAFPDVYARTSSFIAWMNSAINF